MSPKPPWDSLAPGAFFLRCSQFRMGEEETVLNRRQTG